MKPLRIAYVINSLEGGGAASPVPAITRVLRECGAEVRLFALARRDARALPAIDASDLEAEICEAGEGDQYTALSWLDRGVAAWGATHLWTSLTRATLLGQLVGAKRGLPVVSWQHNVFLKPWNRRLLRLMQSRSVLWVADSRSVEALTAERLKVSSDRLFLWPIFAADPGAPRAAAWRPGDTLQLGSLGRLHPRKGYDVLIAALARLRAEGFEPPAPFEVSIAGAGADEEALKAEAARAGVENLSFAGFVDDPRGFLSSLHLYLQPSRAEGFCIAAHEAMQAGLPVIGAKVGEMPWTLAGGDFGAVVEPGDVDTLAAALKDLLSRPEQLAAMGAAARTYVLDHFSEARFAAAGRAIMERLSAS